MPEPRPLAKPVDVAEYLGVPVSRLATMRHRGIGPRFVRPTGGRAIRYDWADVEAYVAAQKFSRTDSRDPDPAPALAGR